MAVLGFIGGTGPQGRGLAARFGLAGHQVLLGSRDAGRAQEAAAKLGDAAAGIDVRGDDNAAVCVAAEILFVVVPYEAQRATLEPLAGAIGDKVVVNCVNAMAFDERGPFGLVVAAGSAAEECGQLLPAARVVSAFHDISATKLRKLDQPMTEDVLFCGDDEDAKAQVIALTNEVSQFRGVDCGPLRMSSSIENLTPVLVSINQRYKVHAGIRIEGLPRNSI